MHQAGYDQKEKERGEFDPRVETLQKSGERGIGLRENGLLEHGGELHQGLFEKRPLA